jgi:hypothetical protein
LMTLRSSLKGLISAGPLGSSIGLAPHLLLDTTENN